MHLIFKFKALCVSPRAILRPRPTLLGFRVIWDVLASIDRRAWDDAPLTSPLQGYNMANCTGVGM